jgi:hypothetical protein
MARSSTIIRRGFCDSDRIAALPGWFEECVFHRLLLHGDDHGLLDARPSFLRSLLFPLQTDRVREADVSRALHACESAGLIRFYKCPDGKSFLEIQNYGQRNDKTKPKYPLPPWRIPDASGKFPEIPAIDVDGYEDEDEVSIPPTRVSTTVDTSSPPKPRQTLPESQDQVMAYMAAQPNCGLKGQELAACAFTFFDDAESVGWTHKGQPIRNWKAAARSYLHRWQLNLSGKTSRTTTRTPRKQDCNANQRYDLN